MLLFPCDYHHIADKNYHNEKKGNGGVSFDLLFSKIARKDDCKDYYNTIKVLSGHKQGK